MDSVFYENIYSIEIILKSYCSDKIFINFKERNIGLILKNNIVDNVIYQLSHLSLEIFHTEYNKIHYDNNYKFDHHESFRKMHKIEIIFNSSPDKHRIRIESNFFNITVDSKKYDYIYDDIIAELVAFLEKLNNINIDDVIFP